MAVRFSYPGGGTVLPAWQWQAQPGLLQLVDAYSVGKTTALQLLAGRLAAAGGSLLVDGQSPAQLQAAHELFWHEPRKPETMPPDTITLAQWADSLRAHFASWDAALLAELQQGLGLAEHWHKPLLALSTGSLRKAVLALGLASGAKLVLLDEPLSGLDKPALAYVPVALQAAAQRFAREGRYLVLAHYEALLPAGAGVQALELPS
ncbi:ATP-binding cassette domain-containing protein [Comamonas sp. J-3]|uniref:ABC transporter ATP-binding protein n=1 Tax=Comamonas trifloxystrobinivorans TaxID=3350256 RepID=UPI00372AB87E